MTDQNECESKNFISTTVYGSLTINRLFLTWLRIGCTSFGGGAAITIGISAIYASISELPKVQAALRAVFAAIFGIALGSVDIKSTGLIVFLYDLAYFVA